MRTATFASLFYLIGVPFSTQAQEEARALAQGFGGSPRTARKSTDATPAAEPEVEEEAEPEVESEAEPEEEVEAEEEEEEEAASEVAPASEPETQTTAVVDASESSTTQPETKKTASLFADEDDDEDVLFVRQWGCRCRLMPRT